MCAMRDVAGAKNAPQTAIGSTALGVRVNCANHVLLAMVFATVW